MESVEITEDETDNTSDEKPAMEAVAPDGGWGWLVCFGSFVMIFIMDGTMWSCGVLMIELLDYFKGTKTLTSMVGSTYVGLSMACGPVVSLMLEKYSFRQVAIAGALLNTFAFIAAIFSPNVEILILTYGVLGGIGCSMMFITACVVVGMYFDKKRAVATGIAMSGSGIGIFFYSYFVEKLTEIYDWRGCVLILSGLIANCIVFGAILRPLSAHGRNKRSGSCAEAPLIAEKSNGNNGTYSNPDPSTKYFSSLDNIQKNGKHSITNQKNVHKHIDNQLSMSHDDVSRPRFRPPNIGMSQSHTALHVDKRGYHVSEPRSGANPTFLNPILRKDVFYSGSIMNLPEYKSAENMEEYIKTVTDTEPAPGGHRGLWQNIRSVFDFSLLRNPMFLLLLISFVMWTAQSVPVTFVPDLAVSRGLTKEEAAILISILGATNTVGRLIFGFVVDVLRVQSLTITTIFLFVGAGANFALPYCETFWMFACCTAAFGLCMAAAVSLRTIVLADVLGIGQLTKSFGVAALFQGIAFLLFPPLAGKIFDETSSYVYPFVLVGVSYIISGIASFIVLILHTRVRRKDREADITVSSDDSEKSYELIEEKLLIHSDHTSDCLLTESADVPSK